jgi:cytochrome c
MRPLLPLLTLGAALLLATTAWAAGVATPDEAKARTIKTADYLKSVGPEKAFPEFNAKDGPWHDRDLYVTVEADNGIMVANGANAGRSARISSSLRTPTARRSGTRNRRSRTTAG